MPPPPSTSSSSLGKSLYRRILKELRATRNFDHHLRDIRFLLWVPGTKGKRQYDELKRLAVMSSSLHMTRSKSSPTTSSSNNNEISTTSPSELQQPKKKNVTPSIADQIRAVARGLFRKEKEKMQQFTEMLSKQNNPSSSNSTTQQKILTPAEIAVTKAKSIQDGTKRAFWAIKRLQDIRAGLVPNASMWLVVQGGSGMAGPTSSAYQNYLSPPPSAAAATARANMMLLAAVTGNSTSTLPGNKETSSSSSNKKSKSSTPVSFDPFVIPKDAQLRSGNFPFLHEFLGIDEEGTTTTNKSSNTKKNSSSTKKNTNDTSKEEVHNNNEVEEHLEKLQTFGKSKNKVLKLELVSRCAAKEGPSARYHLSFRLENISEYAVDVKLAHLFAIQCETPPVLNEMVCLLPLLGNSILSPYSSSAFDQDEDDDEDENNNNNTADDEEEANHDDDQDELNTENLKSVPRNRSAKKQDQNEEEEEDSSDEDDESKKNVEEIISDAPHHQFTRKIRINSSSETPNTTLSSSTTSSLPYVTHRSKTSTAPDFTAKAKTPDHCAVYDVSVPFQGECVLRGFVLYRTITNAFPSAAVGAEDEEQNVNSEEANTSSKSKKNQNTQPSTVKSRLKVLHLPVIKLVPPSED